MARKLTVKRQRQCKAAAKSRNGQRCSLPAKYPRPHRPDGKRVRCHQHRADRPDWNQDQHSDSTTPDPPHVVDSDSDYALADMKLRKKEGLGGGEEEEFDSSDIDIDVDVGEDNEEDEEIPASRRTPMLDRRSRESTTELAFEQRTGGPDVAHRMKISNKSAGPLHRDMEIISRNPRTAKAEIVLLDSLSNVMCQTSEVNHALANLCLKHEDLQVKHEDLQAQIDDLKGSPPRKLVALKKEKVDDSGGGEVKVIKGKEEVNQSGEKTGKPGKGQEKAKEAVQDEVRDDIADGDRVTTFAAGLE